MELAAPGPARSFVSTVSPPGAERSSTLSPKSAAFVPDPRHPMRLPFALLLGALLPFGDHKGYGLALMCELLAGGLSGAGTIPGRTDWGVIDNNMLCVLIDPAKLGGADTQAAEAERVIEWVRSTPAADGFDRV
eukprot:gene49484-60586_t